VSGAGAEAAGGGEGGASGGWVDPAEVEHALAALWRSDRGGPTMIRACLTNLVVVCTDAAQRQAIEAELPEIARHHPSRILLVLADEGAAPAAGEAAGPPSPGADGAGGERRIEAHVSALCHVEGKAGRTCSEQILLSAGGRATEALPAAARSLLLSDLPTVLWWAPGDRPPPAHGERFRAFEALAEHLLYDSGPWLRGPQELLSLIDDLGQPGVPARTGDLAWLRTEPWRRLLAQTLDPARVPGALAGLRAVEIEHGPRGAAEAWLLGAWLTRCLAWRPEGGEPSRWQLASGAGPVEVRLQGGEGEAGRGDSERGGATDGAGSAGRRGEASEGREAGTTDDSGLRGVRVVWRSDGREQDERFERTGPARLAATGCAGEECGLADPWSETWELVVRELSRRSHHGLFRETLDAAAAVARAVDA